MYFWGGLLIAMIFGTVGALMGQNRATGMVGGAALGFFLGPLGLLILAVIGINDHHGSSYTASLYQPAARGPMSHSASSPGHAPWGYMNAPPAPDRVQQAPLQPGWHVDPARRAGMRYYDGREWTQHVLDKHPDGSSTQYEDPI